MHSCLRANSEKYSKTSLTRTRLTQTSRHLEQKKLVMVCFFFENSLDIPLGVVAAFYVKAKVIWRDLANF